MTYSGEAVYEGGVLRLDKLLPLAEGQRVHITVDTELNPVKRSYGLMGWEGDAATVEYFAMSPDLELGNDPEWQEEP